MTIEWQFNQHSETMDVQELFLGVAKLPEVRNYAFMEGMRSNAPILFDRLRVYATQNNVLLWYKWPEAT